MAEYTVRDEETGKIVTFNWQGDTEPTDADMEEVFKDARNMVSQKNGLDDILVGSLKDTGKKLVGGAEGILQTVTGALATPVAGLAGTIRSAGWLNPEEGAQTVEDVQKALTYKPQIFPEQAKNFTDVVNKPLEILEKVGTYVGDKVYDLTGQPELAAGAKAGTMLATPGAVVKGAGAIKGGVHGLAGRTANSLYEGAVKIPPSIDTAIRERAVKTGLEGEYSVSKGGLRNLRKDIDAINKDIADTVNGMSGGVEMSEVVKRIDSLKSFYDRLPPEVAREFTEPLTELQNKYASAGTITPKEAQSMKQTIYALNRKHYGDLKGTLIEGNKAVARGIKEELVKMNEELQGLNARDSAMIELDNFLERAMNRIGNYEAIRVGDIGLGVVGGAKFGLISKIFNNPWAWSKFAIILNKASKRGKPMRTVPGMPPTKDNENEGNLYR